MISPACDIGAHDRCRACDCPQLGQLERDKDEIYVALCRIAAQYMLEEAR